MAATFVGVTLLTFAIARSAPGAASIGSEAGLRAGAGAAQIREYRHLMGLEGPVLPGYLRWLSRLARADLGTSFRDGRPVASLLAEALPVTLLLSVPSLAIAYLLALAVGIASALRPHGVADRVLAALSFLFYSVPLQWAALMLVLYGASVGLPIQGLHSEGRRNFGDMVQHLILPVVALASGSIALLSRYLRSAIFDALEQDYVTAARARGLSQGGVVLRHALPNAAITLVALLGLTLPALVSGAVIVERIFGIPGMGNLAFEAVLGRDVPVLMGTTTLAAVMTVAGMLLSDLLYAAVDPRISLRSQQ